MQLHVYDDLSEFIAQLFTIRAHVLEAEKIAIWFLFATACGL